MNSTSIAIVDYGVGNLLSVKRAFDYLNVDTFLTTDPKLIRSSGKVIVPGVGAFPRAINFLNESGISEELALLAEKDSPILGICLGMQLLFENSEEHGFTKGLSILKGSVIPMRSVIPSESGVKIPQIGWHPLELADNLSNNSSLLLNQIDVHSEFYFVHSYMVKPEISMLLKSSYRLGGIDIPAVIESGSIFGCQFHPEKSGPAGLAILKNFSKL